MVLEGCLVLQRVGASEDSQRENVMRERDDASVSHSTPETTVRGRQRNVLHLLFLSGVMRTSRVIIEICVLYEIYLSRLKE